MKISNIKTYFIFQKNNISNSSYVEVLLRNVSYKKKQSIFWKAIEPIPTKKEPQNQ
ncbi:MAG: hypothetical protein ACPG19_05085 [Saprospiraceae bacterium]